MESARASDEGRTTRARVRKAATLGFTLGLTALLVQVAVRGTSSPTSKTARPDAAAVASEAPTPVARALAPADPSLPATFGLAAAGPSAEAAPPEPAWALPAGRIDPGLAVLEGDSLVQHLDDGVAIELTLDPELQRAVQGVLESYRVDFGAVVAVRPSTGEVLVLAEYAEGRPELRHFALQAEGPAASIFKLVTAAALLRHGGLEPGSSICASGGHHGLTLDHLRDDPKYDKKCETLAEAFGSSNNVAFGRWADRLLTPALLQETAEGFLFNRRLPFLWGVGTSRVRIPVGSRLDFARSAAGFKGSTLSPLHGALLAAAVAHDGVMMAPRLVRRAALGSETLYASEPASLGRVVPSEIARDLRRLMAATAETGTARKFFQRGTTSRFPGVEVGGKTGSLSGEDDGVTRHYSWFVGIAPVEDADIAVAALVVNGAEWKTKGVVLARHVFEAWYQVRR